MYEDLGYKVLVYEGLNKKRSIKLGPFNALILFTQMDIINHQYATIACLK
jgi:hypothetical protein